MQYSGSLNKKLYQVRLNSLSVRLGVCVLGRGDGQRAFQVQYMQYSGSFNKKLYQVRLYSLSVRLCVCVCWVGGMVSGSAKCRYEGCSVVMSACQ